MHGQEPKRISSLHTAPHRTEQISAETIERCAQLLANGEIDWPAGLSDEQEAELLINVRRCRRARLVQFVGPRDRAGYPSHARQVARRPFIMFEAFLRPEVVVPLRCLFAHEFRPAEQAQPPSSSSRK